LRQQFRVSNGEMKQVVAVSHELRYRELKTIPTAAKDKPQLR
jgi:hypothetical protein